LASLQWEQIKPRPDGAYFRIASKFERQIADDFLNGLTKDPDFYRALQYKCIRQRYELYRAGARESGPPDWQEALFKQHQCPDFEPWEPGLSLDQHLERRLKRKDSASELRWRLAFLAVGSLATLAVGVVAAWLASL
jgi:hypothetical protein